MEILYEIHFTTGKISKVCVEKTTDKSVWVERDFKFVRREPWVNDYFGFYHTFHEAQKAGADKLQKEIDALQEQTNRWLIAKQRVTNIEEAYVDGPLVFQELKFTAEMLKG